MKKNKERLISSLLILTPWKELVEERRKEVDYGRKKKQKKDWRIGRGRRNKNKTRRKIIFKGIVLGYKMRR